VWTFGRTLVIVLRGLVKALSRETCDFVDLLGYDSLPVNTGASGLCKAREKLKYQVFRELLRRTSRHFYGNCRNVRLEGGYRLLGIDTSIMLLPEEPEIRQRFGPWRRGPGQEGPPQGRLSVLLDLHNGVVLDAYCAGTHIGDRRLAKHHFKCLQANDILVMDRGYFGDKFVGKLSKLPGYFVVRIPVDADRQVKRFVASGDESAILIYDEEPVRAVRIELPDGKVEVLLTNLTSPSLDAAFFREIYAARWGSETHFLHLKHALEGARFSGRSVNKVLQDIYGKCLAISLLNMLGADAKAVITDRSADCEHTRGLSVLDGLNQLRTHLPRLLLGVATAVADICARLHHRFLHCHYPIRPDRKHPRDTTRKPPRYPDNRKPV
jgi:hypothetical protein